MEWCGKDEPKIGNSEEDEQLSYALQLSNMSVMPMVLKAAIDLELLEIIAKAGPGAQLSPTEIVGQMPTRNPDAPSMVDRILRLLASYSVLSCSLHNDGHRLYGLAPVAKYYVRNNELDGASFGPLMALIHDKVFMDTWYALKDAVLEGGVPFDKVHGMQAFDYPGNDPRFNEAFNKAMTNHTTIVIKKILECYKGFDHLKQLVDVGGGLGVNLNMIVSKYPNIKGINFDLPHVIQHAPSYPGVEHIGGDMFVDVPKADAIFMKWILHDWSDDHCLKLLRNCYKALPEDGKVIVVEAILPVIPNNSVSVKTICQVDLVMMTQNPGGKERTQQEFLDLAIGAGFSGITLECFASNIWVIEFYKYLAI